MAQREEHAAGRMARGRAEHVLELLGSACIAVWECDLTTGKIGWTGDLEAMFGRRESQFDGTLRGLLEVVHPEDHARMAKAVEIALGRGGLYEVEFRTVLPDGSTRWLGERGRVLQDEMGQPVRIVGIVQDITERKAAEEALVLQALHDPLTDLPNRILFRERVTQVISQRPDGRVTALMVLDLDGFKEVNDRHGHAVGDEVLREIATRWRAVLRRGETLARLVATSLASSRADWIPPARQSASATG